MCEETSALGVWTPGSEGKGAGGSGFLGLKEEFGDGE